MSTSHYDGEHIVVHTIRHGESLSVIAKKYGFASWNPIFVFNTKVHRTLGANPNLINAGKKILIPRSKQGYDKLITKLQLLRDTALAGADMVKDKLEGEYNKHQAERVLFDFAGDVLTLVATTSQKVFSYTSKYKMAANASGEASVRVFETAMKEQRALQVELGKKLGDKAVNEGLGVVDPDLKKAHKDLYLTQRKGIQAIMKAGTSMLDVADILLDYVAVSNVADTLIAIGATELVSSADGLEVKVGEAPAETYRRAQETIKQSKQRTQRQLDEKIAKYRREKQVVHAA